MDSEHKPFSLAVGAVIVDAEDRCLLLRRAAANPHFAGCWEWPGGKLEPGENFAEGLRREVMEESGLRIELTGLAGATEFEIGDVRVIFLCLDARAVDGEPRLSKEHDRFAWVTFSQLNRYALVDTVKPFMLEHAHRRRARSDTALGDIAPADRPS